MGQKGKILQTLPKWPKINKNRGFSQTEQENSNVFFEQIWRASDYSLSYHEVILNV